MPTQLPTAHILYENPAWLPPLTDALEAEGFPINLVKLDEGLVDPAHVPDDGIWINRISPSSHTRGHHGSVELTREVLFWLELNGRRVINGLKAFEFEMSKLRQDLVLNRYGIRTPRTVLAVGRDAIVKAARAFDGPFITKHNQGGKGLGIQLFHGAAALERYLDSGEFDPGPGGKIILQQYIEAAEPFITRVEIAGGRFLFAMRSNTEQGFELCPSDACQLPADGAICPADGSSSKFSKSPITEDDPLVQKYIKLMEGEGIEVAGIEFIEDAEGHRYTYDINGTTNYSGVLADVTGIEGMKEVARWLKLDVVPKVVVAQPTL
ncbi:MAG: alpha-L-glutamate ligase [Myxococcota bacterium]|nr:alpha-L-glutamate ligase [Myxococcota bacterium]